MFEDRETAGFLLSKKLEKFASKHNILVLGLTRGGIPVAKVISTFLECPLNVLVVKKISAPLNSELAIGAVAPGNVVFWNKHLIMQLKIKPAQALELRKAKEDERKSQEMTLRVNKPLEISGKTVILVDDGVATGASVIASAKFLKKQRAKEIVLAVPVIAKDTLSEIKGFFDMIVALKVKREFYAVGQFYKNFPQVENEEVIRLLQ